MLQITIPKMEAWDEKNEEFVILNNEQTIQLEHSLVSISKWESKWCKPFYKKGYQKTNEEIMDYIKCMTITQNVKPETYNFLSNSNIKDITDYIEAPMTATTFSNTGPKSNEQITSELIYFWMINWNIPMECQKWHINRLLTLIRVCSIKNTPPKKMSQRDTINKYASLNAARRQQYGSKG